MYMKKLVLMSFRDVKVNAVALAVWIAPEILCIWTSSIWSTTTCGIQ